MSKHFWITLRIFPFLLFGLIIISCSTIDGALHTATGFSAKNVCSGHFVSGFSHQQILDEALLPISKTFHLVDIAINEDQQSVETDLFYSHKRKAVYKEGFGCVLLAPDQEKLDIELPDKSLMPVKDKQQINLSWPQGSAEIQLEKLNSEEKQINQLVKRHFDQSKLDHKLRTKGLVVIYKGKLIAEQYAKGVTKSTPLLSWSMAKSITNLQVGLLVDQGILSLERPLSIPEWRDNSYQQINLANMLTMTSGLEFDETYGIGGDAALMLSVVPSADQFARNKPMIHKPGTHWYYSSGTTNIISGIIRRSFDKDYQAYLNFTQEKLFEPLNIDSAILEMDSSGTFIGSSYMYASARDWAKIGQMLIQNGKWNGKTILPASWIEYSKIPTSSNPTNRYGAHFWLNRNPKNTAKNRFWPDIPEDTFYMTGFQGQRIVMIPSKQLVFVRLGFTTPKYPTKLDQLMKGVIDILQKAKPEWNE